MDSLEEQGGSVDPVGVTRPGSEQMDRRIDPVPVAALLLDLAFAEPPETIHPVVWFGRTLAAAERRVPHRPADQRRWGAVVILVGAAAVATTGRWLRRAPWPVAALVLQPAFSLRRLLEEMRGVERALGEGVERGRRAVARIVGRDVSRLDEALIREAALESLAENLSDSVVAPAFWYAVAGLPGAWVYRWVNTADAVWGHRDHRLHYGAAAARLDDLASFLPARLTGVMLLLALGGRRRLRELADEARKTPSPNGGWPMGAAALGLGVRLRKLGAYHLNPGGATPVSADVARLSAAALTVGVGSLLSAAWISGRRR